MSQLRRRLLMILPLLASAGFARLGVWQLSRLHQRRAANATIAAARAAPPVRLEGAQLGATDTLAERRVEAAGTYDRSHEVVIRGAVLEGVPGVRVVTPLLLRESGPAVLVERGFVPAADAVTPPSQPLEEAGRVMVRGIALPVPAGSGQPLKHGGATTWRRLDLAALRRRLPYPVLPIYILQTPDSALPRFPRRTPAPALDDGPHLSYAVQWFLFAALAAAFTFLVVGRGRRAPAP